MSKARPAGKPSIVFISRIGRKRGQPITRSGNRGSPKNSFPTRVPTAMSTTAATVASTVKPKSSPAVFLALCATRLRARSH